MAGEISAPVLIGDLAAKQTVPQDLVVGERLTDTADLVAATTLPPNALS